MITCEIFNNEMVPLNFSRLKDFIIIKKIYLSAN